jgi:hypothetical protein
MKRIIYQSESGGVAVIIPTESVELALKDLPEGTPYEIVEEADIPSDRTFRGAWVMGNCCIEHDLGRCKDIAHNRRRADRAAEFAPYDELIAKQVPGVDAAEAEAARQSIREKYAMVQDAINIAGNLEAIKFAQSGLAVAELKELLRLD